MHTNLDKDYEAYCRDENSFDPCPWCHAPWIQNQRIHNPECGYWIWLTTEEENDE